MGEESLPSVFSVSDRALEQAILALKKGAHLLKYGRRGKLKFCPVKLSMDEKFLIWYSGQEEKKLRLSTVTNILQGQNTKQLQLEKESQCLSLIYANGKCSLELVCKDKVQAESWFIGLRAVISRNFHKGTIGSFKKQRGAQSCINSPAAFMRRKQILRLSESKISLSEVHSLSGSPPSSFSARCTSDGMSCSSDSFYSASSLSNTRKMVNFLASTSPLILQDDINNRAACATTSATHFPDSSIPEMHVLKDVYIWGEGAGGGYLGGGETQLNALLPKLLESAMMLDVQTISVGMKHAALVTRQGEVFCWGEGKRGRLGHKVDMDTHCPKIVDSLTGIHVNNISCGAYQTCALTFSGELYTWGDNYTADFREDSKSSHWLPHRLSGSLDGLTISNVACGEWHTAIVSTCGRLFTYGDGTFGALGHGDLQSYSHAKKVESINGLRVKTVACGLWHTAAVIEIVADCGEINNPGGKLFTWGDSDKGRLGHPEQERKLLPTYVAELFDHDFVQVSCGDALTAGLTTTGRVYTIGSAAHGQLGAPHARDKSIVAVKGRLIDEFVVQISSGSWHIAVLTSKGNVYTWGKGENGQLGLGDTKDRNSPSLVDTLKGRKVEKVTCGSSTTGAICAHKSLSTADQLACRGCGSTFGFTRKKHNCYNCGRVFCRACCSKRSMCASLAPNGNKSFRVCNGCFSQLQSSSCPVVLPKSEANNPRPSPITRKCHSNGTEGIRDAGSTHSQAKSIGKYSYDGDRSSERKDFNIQGQKIEPPDLMYMDKALLRWGQVSRPKIFTDNYRDSTVGRIPALGHELSSKFSVCLLDSTLEVNSMAATSLHAEKDSDPLGKYISEEILKLKAKADSLEKLCQTRKEKIQENEKKTKEAWSLAKDEAAKCEEANEIIKALTSKLCEMSEKTSGGQGAEDKADCKFPQTRIHPILAVAHTPTKVVQLEDSNVENLCSSPIVFSSKLRSLYEGDLRSGMGRMDSAKTGTKCSEVEWIEQYQPGVFITFTALPDGKIGLRRVRFSRKKFNDREAKRWWEENQHTVYRSYGIDGYSISNS